MQWWFGIGPKIYAVFFAAQGGKLPVLFPKASSCARNHQKKTIMCLWKISIVEHFLKTKFSLTKLIYWKFPRWYWKFFKQVCLYRVLLVYENIPRHRRFLACFGFFKHFHKSVIMFIFTMLALTFMKALTILIHDLLLQEKGGTQWTKNSPSTYWSDSCSGWWRISSSSRSRSG